LAISVRLPPIARDRILPMSGSEHGFSPPLGGTPTEPLHVPLKLPPLFHKHSSFLCSEAAPNALLFLLALVDSSSVSPRIRLQMSRFLRIAPFFREPGSETPISLFLSPPFFERVGSPSLELWPRSLNAGDAEIDLAGPSFTSDAPRSPPRAFAWLSRTLLAVPPFRGVFPHSSLFRRPSPAGTFSSVLERPKGHGG